MHKILIVEDTLSIREEVFDILTMEGYTVFQAENGEIGFEMALKEKPDLIISDILMPEMNGFEMFEKLHKEKKTKSIPLIFLSAKGEKRDIRIGMNLGAEDYLTKPVNIDDLMSAVENKIQKKLFIDQNIIDKTLKLSNILKNQENELDNYAHLVSHELKSCIRNVSDLLTWTQEDAKETDNFNGSNHLQLMEEKVEKMENLLVQLEQYKNIAHTSFKNKDINIHTIVQRVIDEIPESPHITIKIKNQLPTLFADENMLQKVFEVLIQNAIKHIDHKNGVIELGCKTTKKEYIFSIKDNGISIHEKYHRKIFKMFETIKSTTSAGIGLSIVKKIISYYNGDVYLESISNKERTFYLNLPKTTDDF
ncbi:MULTISPECIES: response regulator [unclassified Polaribacter]|uniref:sensor histidine kinase n=1 Tax=unclassified Polaribacter TaxID=196858 RepID=UPI000569E786|nr:MULTISPECIES: response regulator [unclassified Polaribacter]PKV65874.1 histidine kinase/DNA gyrase B/HSP90-like ATPase [Polaribacter sp. Hel1_33_96]